MCLDCVGLFPHYLLRDIIASNEPSLHGPRGAQKPSLSNHFSPTSAFYGLLFHLVAVSSFLINFFTRIEESGAREV